MHTQSMREPAEFRKRLKREPAQYNRYRKCSPPTFCLI